MIRFSTNELKALEMLLSYIHNTQPSYNSKLTGQIKWGKFFISTDELHHLLKLETILKEEIDKRKEKEDERIKGGRD